MPLNAKNIPHHSPRNDDSQAISDSDAVTSGDGRHRRSLRAEVRDAIQKIKANDVTSIRLVQLSITDEEVIAIAEALYNNTSLRRRELSYNNICPEGAIALAKLLRSNTPLEELGLSGNDLIDQKAVIDIAESLMENHFLSHLELMRINVADGGALALAKTIKYSQSLKTLILYGCDISSIGAKALASALKVSTSMHRLNLEHNKIRDDGAVALAESLFDNKDLFQLRLAGNQRLTDVTAKAFADVLRVNQVLVLLDLEGTQITDSGVKVLAEALKINDFLTQIELSNWFITDVGVRAIVHVVQHYNRRIEDLSLDGPKIHDKHIIDGINSAIKDNRDRASAPTFERNQIFISHGGRSSVNYDAIRALENPAYTPSIQRLPYFRYEVSYIHDGRFVDDRGFERRFFTPEEVRHGQLIFFESDTRTRVIPQCYIKAVVYGFWMNYTSEPRRVNMLLTPTDDAPFLRQSPLSVWPNRGVEVTAAHMSAVDRDSAFDEIVFIFYAMKSMVIQNLGNTVPNVTQSDIIDGNVTVLADGLSYPKCLFNISDGEHRVGPFECDMHLDEKWLSGLSDVERENLQKGDESSTSSTSSISGTTTSLSLTHTSTSTTITDVDLTSVTSSSTSSYGSAYASSSTDKIRRTTQPSMSATHHASRASSAMSTQTSDFSTIFTGTSSRTGTSTMSSSRHHDGLTQTQTLFSSSTASSSTATLPELISRAPEVEASTCHQAFDPLPWFFLGAGVVVGMGLLVLVLYCLYQHYRRDGQMPSQNDQESFHDQHSMIVLNRPTFGGDQTPLENEEESSSHDHTTIVGPVREIHNPMYGGGIDHTDESAINPQYEEVTMHSQPADSMPAQERPRYETLRRRDDSSGSNEPSVAGYSVLQQSTERNTGSYEWTDEDQRQLPRQ